MRLPDKVYDVLKWIALIALPACGTLQSVLSGVWGLPYGEEVLSTITAVGTFVGALLGISTVNYNKTNTTKYNPNTGR